MFAVALPRQKLLIQVNSKIGQNRWLLNWPLKTGFACIEVHGATLFIHRGWCQVSGGESNKQLVPRRYSKKKERALAGRSTCSALVLRVWLVSEQQRKVSKYQEPHLEIKFRVNSRSRGRGQRQSKCWLDKRQHNWHTAVSLGCFLKPPDCALDWSMAESTGEIRWL